MTFSGRYLFCFAASSHESSSAFFESFAGPGWGTLAESAMLLRLQAVLQLQSIRRVQLDPQLKPVPQLQRIRQWQPDRQWKPEGRLLP